MNAIRIDEERHRTHTHQVQTTARLSRLTTREREVLDALADGLSHKEIAEKLSISARTVEVYKARMMDKLQCDTLAEVVRLAIEARASAAERSQDGSRTAPEYIFFRAAVHVARFRRSYAPYGHLRSADAWFGAVNLAARTGSLI
jgi:DNA-binding CsgD family transcriptional regulator